MAPILGILIATMGWRDTWKVMGIMVLVVMVPVILLLVRRQPEDMGLQPDGDRTASQALSRSETVPGGHGGQGRVRPGGPATEVSWTLQEAMRTRTLWLLVVALNLVNLSATAIVLHMVPFLMFQEGLSAQAAGLVVSMRLVASTFSRLLWGYAVDRFPMNLCLVVGFATRALNPLSLALLPYPLNVAGVIVTSITGGGFQVLQPMAFANYFGRRHTGAIQGAIRPFVTVSSLVGPLFISIVFDLTGTFDLAFLVAGGLGLLSAVVVLFATPPRKPAQPSPVASKPAAA